MTTKSTTEKQRWRHLPREIRIFTLLVLVSALLLLFGIYARPPYIFYQVLRSWTAGLSVALAIQFWSSKTRSLVLVVLHLSIAGIYWFAKMQRGEWAVINWLTLAVQCTSLIHMIRGILLEQSRERNGAEDEN